MLRTSEDRQLASSLEEEDDDAAKNQGGTWTLVVQMSGTTFRCAIRAKRRRRKYETAVS